MDILTEFNMRIWIIVIVCGLAQPFGDLAAQPLVSHEFSGGESVAGALNSPAAISACIADLDSNRFSIREKATQKLAEMGVVAFDALLEVANSKRPEAAERALWILQEAAIDRTQEEEAGGVTASPPPVDQEVRRAALVRLAKVTAHPDIAFAAEEELAQIDHERAVAAIAELGGQYLERGRDSNLGITLETRVELDENWRGGDEGLKHLLDVQDALLVKINRAPVTAAGIAQLRDMPALRQLEIYCQELSDAEVETIKQQLPGVEVIYRRGALLGVTGTQFGPAVVNTVQPDSAAAEAGILAGDVIQKVDGRDINTFQELTDAVAEYEGGAEATLVISRGGQLLEKPVKFGSW